MIDVVAEPGIGKSRLLYEFRQRIGKGRAFILSGGCSSDGQQTPFLPFIEVVRHSFQVSAGEAEKEIGRKLELGLTILGRHSIENLGLLLNLLGLKAPEGALTGLDGVLIGLRTRDLLLQPLEARCRLTPVVMLLEDLHWIDGASDELLGKVVDGAVPSRLLLVHTRRPDHVPVRVDRPSVSTLRLEPLPAGDIRRLVQGRLGTAELPDPLARQVTEKAEGNALFAEEIVAFLTEKGVLRAPAGGRLDYDASAVAAALPTSIQGLLAQRVSRLTPGDRSLLQAASVIGRRFDAELLAAVMKDTSDVDARLAAMRGLDLFHPELKSGEYIFKHALVRDALYQSLLSAPRASLHLKIAEEIERRHGNRISEVAGVLAHHYRQTDRAEKAFRYLAIAGARSLGVYSLDEAEVSFAAAADLLERHPDCATDADLTDLLANYPLVLSLKLKLNTAIALMERYAGRVDRLGIGNGSLRACLGADTGGTFSRRSNRASLRFRDLPVRDAARDHRREGTAAAPGIAAQSPDLDLCLSLAAPRIPTILARVRQNRQFDPNGHFFGRTEMILGLFYKAKRKRDMAVRHLSEAGRIVGEYGETPMLAKIDAALDELR